ncbi:MAG: hypothetical protein ACXWWB_11650 [Nitrospira sp.]
MYELYRGRGFEAVAFPANDFGQQEPRTNQEIKGFCYTKYSISFPLFSKISLTGKGWKRSVGLRCERTTMILKKLNHLKVRVGSRLLSGRHRY